MDISKEIQESPYYRLGRALGAMETAIIMLRNASNKNEFIADYLEKTIEELRKTSV